MKLVFIFVSVTSLSFFNVKVQVLSLQRGLMARMLGHIVLDKHLVGPVTKTILLSPEVSKAEVHFRLLVNVHTGPFLNWRSALACRISFSELICPKYDGIEVLDHII